MISVKQFVEWARKKSNWVVLGYDDNNIYFNFDGLIALNDFADIAQKSENLLIVQKTDAGPVYCLQASNLEKFMELTDPNMAQEKVPDLSWATCKQIASELKKRQSLTFVLLYIEDDAYDNINVEASGDANTILGLTMRGISLILNATEKRSIIQKPTEDD